jgi:hypothetical protein
MKLDEDIAVCHRSDSSSSSSSETAVIAGVRAMVWNQLQKYL